MRFKIMLAVLLGSTSFAVYASAEGPLSAVSSDGLMAIVGSVLLALIAGYARGIEHRLKGVEFDLKQQQSQLSLFRETVLERHPNRAEMNQLRNDMKSGFDELKDLLRERRSEQRKP